MLQLYPVMLEFLQQKVYTGLLSDKMNILDYFMAQSNVQKRRNPFIFQSESNPLKFISFFSSKPYDTANLAFVRSGNEAYYVHVSLFVYMAKNNIIQPMRMIKL